MEYDRQAFLYRLLDNKFSTQPKGVLDIARQTLSTFIEIRECAEVCQDEWLANFSKGKIRELLT